MRKVAGGVLVATLLTWLLVIPAAWARTQNVRIENLEYKPQTVFVNPGDRVRWTHRDDQTPHTVTSDVPGQFDSSDSSTCNALLGDDCMREGDTFDHVFNEVGTFNYHCKQHRNMTGAVRVVPRGGSTTSTSPAPTTTAGSPTKTSPSPSVSGSPTGSPTGSVSPTGTGSISPSETPRAGGGSDDGSGNGRIAVAAVGVLMLSAAGFLVYRRFISSP